MFTNVSEV